MTNDPLVRPVWQALTGQQAHLASGGAEALRIDPGYGPFAAARDPGPAGAAALARLLADEADAIAVLEPDRLAPPPGTHLVEEIACVQMVCRSRPAAPRIPVERLDEDDAPAMRALAEAAQPGPWGPLTHRYGRFVGIRRDGALVAMAGERLRPAAGLVELSGVATADGMRGQGLAEAVVRAVVDAAAERGETVFLHCRADNAGAIRLYERLGFVHSRAMTVSVLVRR